MTIDNIVISFACFALAVLNVFVSELSHIDGKRVIESMLMGDALMFAFLGAFALIPC
jgi:hypothetical protein